MSPPPVDESSVDTGALADPNVRNDVQEFNSKYYHWQEVYYRTSDMDSALRIWGLMKLSRDLVSCKIKVCGRTYQYSITSSILEDLHYIDVVAADSIRARVSGKYDSRTVLTSSLMEEAIASSQIEGASTARRIAKQMLRSRSAPRDDSERMILNNYRAMEGISEWKSLELTPDLIRTMHRTVTDGTLRYGREWEGRFRETDDIVVGNPLEEDDVYHIPPPASEIPALIDGLCSFANDDARMHPILKAVVLHYMIGWIHPFMDGNGRTARCLFYWYVIRSGYKSLGYVSISGAIKANRGKYSEAYQFTETDGYDLTYFMKYNLSCIRGAIDSLGSYLDRKMAEQDAAAEMIRSDGDLNLIEASIIEKQMAERTSISIYDVQSEYGISYQSARKYINHLVEKGYLTVTGKIGKKAFYALDKSIEAKSR